ncbi:MAG: hypothetical protein R3200_07730 [Xanthomonadales bacterium]|nr:hypothetical protein [Xanthomonadales bacterium]
MNFSIAALEILIGGALVMTAGALVWLLSLLIRDYLRGELW